MQNFNFLRQTVFELCEIRTYERTYRRYDETSQNGFRDGQNGYFRRNLKTENFRDYNTSFTSYKEVKNKYRKTQLMISIQQPPKIGPSRNIMSCFHMTALYPPKSEIN